jgi:hypothetical protein
MPIGIFEFVVMTLAVARLTRVIVVDSITQPFRWWVERKESDKHGYVNTISFTTLLNCHWCTGWWAALFVAGISWAFGEEDVVWWLWSALSASYLLGIAEDKLGSDR